MSVAGTQLENQKTKMSRVFQRFELKENKFTKVLAVKPVQINRLDLVGFEQVLKVLS